MATLRTAVEHRRDDDGADFDVDVTLIDEMLRLTPQERLQQNDRTIAAILELRAAFAHVRDDHD